MSAKIDAAPFYTGPQADPLPGARHGRDPERAIKRGPSRVPPEQVAATQRDRLYDGLVHTVAEHGYADATVTDICRAAGVTRPAFYVHFDGKQDAFLDTYRHGTDVVFRMMEHAYEQHEGWREGALAGLRVLLDVLAGVPAFARMAIVEIEAVGPPAWEQRAHFLRRFGRFFDDAPDPQGLADPAQRETLVDMLVGGVYSAIHRHVAAGRADALPELLPVLSHFLFVPFLGPHRGAAQGEQEPFERAIAPCATPPRRSTKKDPDQS
jgi:AcrR family transcriptional regulator